MKEVNCYLDLFLILLAYNIFDVRNQESPLSVVDYKVTICQIRNDIIEVEKKM